jgi:hypothetical protein
MFILTGETSTWKLSRLYTRPSPFSVLYRPLIHLYISKTWIFCDVMQYTESQLIFWRNMFLPSSGMKSKPSKKPAWSRQAKQKWKGHVLSKRWLTFNWLQSVLAYNYRCDNLKSHIRTSVLCVNDTSIKITEYDLNSHVKVKKVKFSVFNYLSTMP